ncbi:MAG: DUF805 domain-containing protein [Bifidobacterium crudilactis]|jgi:uncharacterized membrane protein YhaH (DUF805 family)|nr:DUF805 domain-containing protein [Bifidobacterium crudilactis]MCI1889758.1 DUF805 domain-containing protein [Bifidobacterium crudilactis]
MAQYQATPPILQQPGQYEPPLDQPSYGIGFGKAIGRFWRKYATFSGRASRSEYWWSYLFTTLVSIGIFVLTNSVNLFPVVSGEGRTQTNPFGMISLMASLVFIVPQYAVSARRLHDANKSGHWLWLIGGLSITGTIIMLASIFQMVMWALFQSNPLGNGTRASYGFLFRTGGSYLMQAVMVLLLGLLCLLAGAITNIVMMCLPSQPAGARFDRVPVTAYPTGYAPQPVYQQDMRAPGPGVQYQLQPLSPIPDGTSDTDVPQQQ